MGGGVERASWGPRQLGLNGKYYMKVYTIFDVKSPVQLNNVTPRRNWSVVLEDRTCLVNEYILGLY